MDTMFEVPGSDVKSVHIDDDCVKGASPKYVRQTRPLDDTAEEAASSGTANNDEEEGAQVRIQQ